MIFCVEDDSGIRDLVLYTLRASGFAAEGYGDGAALLEALAEQVPQLILLDIMLPGEDGVSLLKKLRSRPATAHIPVIMATAKGTEYDKVQALDLGADDYLAKPFGMMEMVSRVRAVLRRTAPAELQQVLQSGDILLNPAEHTVTVSGTLLHLTLKEYELLWKFMSNPGIVLSREQLLVAVWGSDFLGETRTVDVHVGTLRTKLGACGDMIETVRGVGYRMMKK